MNDEEFKKQKEFIKKLVKSGIPRKNISANLKTAISPRVIVFRNKPLYKKPRFGNIGLSRSYSTFGDGNVKRAKDFFKSKQK